MSKRVLIGGALVVVVTLALAAPGALAKKPPKPPPEPLTNPALTYLLNNNVYVMTSDGSATQELTGNSNLNRYAPAWSPDGTQIAYLQQLESGKVWVELVIMDADGTDAATAYSFDSGTDINEVPSPQYGLHWFPDGTKILYSTGADIHVLDLVDDTVQSFGLTRVKGADVGPDLDPDTAGFQGVVCYAAGSDRVPLWTRDIHVVEVTEGADGTLSIDTDTITALEFSTDNQDYPVFSPDGSQIAFLDPHTGANLKVVGFNVLTFTFGDPVTVSNAGSIGPSLSWSPDGDWIAFTTNQLSRSSDIFRISPSGTGQTNMTDTRKDAEVSPHWNPAWEDDL